MKTKPFLALLAAASLLSAINASADDAQPTSAELKKGIERKLQTLIVEHIEFESADIRDVLQRLSALSKELSQDGRKINIVLMLPPEKKEAKIAISLVLDKVPLGEVVRYCAMLGGLSVNVEPHAVVLKPLPPEPKKQAGSN